MSAPARAPDDARPQSDDGARPRGGPKISPDWFRQITARLARLSRLLGPRVEVSLVAAFKADPLLRYATLALAIAAWAPLFLTPFLPFADQGINTAVADLIWDTARGHAPAAHFHQIQWTPMPYWTTYAMQSVLGLMFGPLIAGKMVVAFILVLMPLAVMRLLISLGRDPRLGLWAFALGYEHNLYAGWLSLLQGFALATFLLAWLIEARTVREGFKVAPFALLVGLTHVQATWLFGLAGVALTFTRGSVRKRIPIHAAVFAGNAVVVLPWLWNQIHATTTVAAALPAFSFEWHRPAAKISQFFGYTLDDFAQREAERVAAITFGIIVVGPMILGSLLPPRTVRSPGDRWSSVVLLGVPVALYVFLPFAIDGPIAHWHTYPRYGSVILLWLLLVPRPNLRGAAAWGLLPGVLAALVMDITVARQFASFGDRTRPFLDIVRSVPKEASVISVVLDDNDTDPDFKLWPFHQFYAYITAFNHGYSPYMWGTRAIPIVYRLQNALPSPGWYAPFSLDEHGRFYDYIFVQGFAHGDPVASATSRLGLRPQLVKQVDRWRLYRVR